MISAPTGSGKTEAALLPILDVLSKNASHEGIKALYITPLRALNRDLIKRLELLAKEVGVGIAVRHGDTQQSERGRQSRRAPEILITTPETLQSILPTKHLGEALANLKYVVIDEIHELYSNKRGAQLSIALERLEEKSKGFQRIGISATIADIESVKKFLCGSRSCSSVLSDRARKAVLSVELPDSSSVPSEFRERFGLDAGAAARLYSVAEHIKNSDSTIVFANTRQAVEAVGSKLVYLNRIMPFGGIGVHHSSIDKKERIELEDRFKNHYLKAIIATSSLELGIDIGYVDEVVQYGSPRQVLRLVQRVGRSGHSVGKTPRGYIVSNNAVDAIEAAAICEKASTGFLETFRMHDGALDVLFNQVVGIALDKGSTSTEEVLGIIRRSYLYKDIRKDTLVRLLELMGRQRVVGFDGDRITSGIRTRMFYYDHLSMIPDVKKFLVKNTIDNRIISTLDEEFVVNNLDEDGTFITKGLPWKVVSIEGNSILVEPTSELEAAVPDWSGEDIPVSHAVAKGVAALVSNPESLLGSEFMNSDSKEAMKKFLEKHDRSIFPRHKIVIEQTEDYKVVYLPLGTMANEAIGRMLAHFAAARTGHSIYMKATPYFIYLDAPKQIDIGKYLLSVDSGKVRGIMKSVLEETELFRYKFTQISKVFGVLDREATVSRSLARRLISVYKETPIYDETTRELMNNYFDIEDLEKFFALLASKELEIETRNVQSVSHFASILLDAFYYTKELIMPVTPSSQILNSFENFLLGKSIKFICMYCGFNFTRKLSEIKDAEHLECPACGGKMLSIYEDESAAAIKKKLKGEKLTRKEREYFSEALKISSMVEAYGGRAALAMSTYGIGVKTAARVLRMLRREDRFFYLDLIEAQRNFIKNKKYWSI